MSERKRKIIRISIGILFALLWLGALFMILIRSTLYNARSALRMSHEEGVLNALQAIANAIEGKPVAMSIPYELINGVLDVALYLLLGLFSLAVSRCFLQSTAIIAAGVFICLDFAVLITEIIAAAVAGAFSLVLPLCALGLAAGIGIVYLAAFLWRKVSVAYKNSQHDTVQEVKDITVVNQNSQLGAAREAKTVAATRPPRSSNLEILRIAAILMIMYGHFCTHNAVGIDASHIGIYNQFAIYLGQIGNCLFLLISGYFLVDSHFSVKKALLMVFQTWFYGVVILVIFLIAGGGIFSWAQILIMLMPIVFQTYWFVTDFVIYYLFTPLLKRLVNYRSQKCLAVTVWVLFLLCSVTQFCGVPIGYSVLGFFEVALIAAYFRKYPIRRKIPAWLLLLVTIAAFALLGLFVAASNPGPIALPFLQGKGLWFRSFVSVPVLLIAAPLFLLFKSLRVKNIKFINKIAGTTLGVYLLHENYCVRNFLIPKLFTVLNITGQSAVVYALLALAFTAAVFIVCVGIELLRKRAEKAVLVPLLDKWQGGKRLDKFFNSLERKKIEVHNTLEQIKEEA